ncbi:hypothetical protein SASC598P14_014820 [Snodgrassella alvi SCGC AB-598-P14]|nr:hypothetical protein SASC598P14_014820 [Snodgrassella alvi SCGC AB-598-P14]
MDYFLYNSLNLIENIVIYLLFAAVGLVKSVVCLQMNLFFCN